MPHRDPVGNFEMIIFAGISHGFPPKQTTYTIYTPFSGSFLGCKTRERRRKPHQTPPLFAQQTNLRLFLAKTTHNSNHNHNHKNSNSNSNNNNNNNNNNNKKKNNKETKTTQNALKQEKTVTKLPRCDICRSLPWTKPIRPAPSKSL